MSDVQESVSDVQENQVQTENFLPPEDVYCRQVDVVVALRNAFSKFVDSGATDLGELVNKINGELGSMPLFKAQGPDGEAVVQMPPPPAEVAQETVSQ